MAVLHIYYNVTLSQLHLAMLPGQNQHLHRNPPQKNPKTVTGMDAKIPS